jgi:hypothetical protein
VWLEGVENDQTDERKHQNDSGGENKKAFVWRSFSKICRGWCNRTSLALCYKITRKRRKKRGKIS